MIEHTYQELKVGQIGFVEKTITENGFICLRRRYRRF